MEDTRRELAHHYLKHSAVELNETAFMLGYEDANSFFRAFHLWEGTSPGEWRTRHRTAEVEALGELTSNANSKKGCKIAKAQTRNR